MLVSALDIVKGITIILKFSLLLKLFLIIERRLACIVMAIVIRLNTRFHYSVCDKSRLI